VTRVFSGIQPSGDLHLGNYLGALRQWVAMQDDADAVYCLVDLHAVTVPYDPQELRTRTLDAATWLLAVGVDPDRSIIFVQSHVPEHPEMAWVLNCAATMGELGRMVQWKEKSGSRGDSVSVGLFDYPVLQAADIVLYDTDEVPVGDDQRQHVELTRDIAQRVNHRYGEGLLVLPKAVTPRAAARVMDLQHPTNKMSKSADSPKGTVLLTDSPDVIAKKIRSAVTDSGTDIRFDPKGKPGISGLLELMSVATARSIDDLCGEYEGQGYGVFKPAVAEAVVEMLRPHQDRYAQLSAAPEHVGDILADGAAKARTIASVTLARVKEAMGFLGR